ncbi:MAG TPA: hypothetical protein PKA37_03370 [Planctomycetota bacterium]|nr:hypothetical protein [Planctomycetota bacterium]
MNPTVTLWIAGGTASILFLSLWILWLLFRLRRLRLPKWRRLAQAIRVAGLALALYGAGLHWFLSQDHRPGALMAVGSGLAVGLIAWFQLTVVKFLVRNHGKAGGPNRE